MVLPLLPVAGAAAGAGIAGSAWAAHEFPELVNLRQSDDGTVTQTDPPEIRVGAGGLAGRFALGAGVVVAAVLVVALVALSIWTRVTP